MGHLDPHKLGKSSSGMLCLFISPTDFSGKKPASCYVWLRARSSCTSESCCVDLSLCVANSLFTMSHFVKFKTLHLWSLAALSDILMKRIKKIYGQLNHWHANDSSTTRAEFGFWLQTHYRISDTLCSGSCFMAGCCLCLVSNAEIPQTHLDTYPIVILIHGYKCNSHRSSCKIMISFFCSNLRHWLRSSSPHHGHNFHCKESNLILVA